VKVIHALCCFVVLCSVLSSCSSPSPSLYTIAIVGGQPMTGAPRVILLQQVSLARFLERPQIVRSSEDYRLDVMANDWWGEPLGAMIGRVLVDELSTRLPQSIVLNESGAVSAPPDATIALNIRRLDEAESGTLILQAQASISFGSQGSPLLQNFRITEALAGSGTSNEVAAISVAMGKLADGIASTLVTRRAT
jgi:uncharacterized protein